MLKLWIPPEWANELRHSPEVEQAVRESCERIASRAGDGYEVSIEDKPTRVVGYVQPATPEAYYDNLKNNTLLRAMG